MERCVQVLRCLFLGGLTDPLCWSPVGVGGGASGWGVCWVARVGLWVRGVWFVGFSRSCKNSCLSLVRCQVTETARRVCGDGPARAATQALSKNCSPRTRGWTVHDLVALGHEVLPPAHAGMDLQLESVPGQPATASRIHGDGLEGISGA